jgi:hypothetical protein
MRKLRIAKVENVVKKTITHIWNLYFPATSDESSKAAGHALGNALFLAIAAYCGFTMIFIITVYLIIAGCATISAVVTGEKG